MPLILYNTLTKKEEVFTPREEGNVTMYTCGPTVYGRPHIGNYASFLMADLLRRWLEVSGYAVTHAKNITDVGHLVADADEGEDKVEKEARRIAASEGRSQIEHRDVIAVARMYEQQFLEDERALHILEPHHRPRASEYVEQMKEMIEGLLTKGFAYVSDDGIYFSVSAKTPTPYGTLSGNTLDNLSAGARVEVKEEKRHPADFALWKFCVGPNEKHVLRWTSPKGPKGETSPEGFPGWHIECSAMSRSLLGDQIDLHTGGADNIFPHHECEIAQSESFTGKKPFVRLWLHRRRVDIGDQKMSKSLGNVLSIPDIRKMGYSPLDLRYLFLSVHYRTHLKFTEKGLDDAHKARRKILEWMGEIEKMESSTSNEDGAALAEWNGKFSSAMNADLNTPAALAIVFDAMTWSRKKDSWSSADHSALVACITMVRGTFGCFEAEEEEAIPENVLCLKEERAEARTEKNFPKSDALRDQIRALGYEVRDEGGEQILRKL